MLNFGLRIAAIERFQQQMAIAVNGAVGVRGPTRTELDRAIPIPTPAELSAVGAAQRSIGQTIRRGLTLGGPVGAHMIARAAYRSQVPLHDRTVVDEWKTIEEDVAQPRRDA